MPVKVNFIFSKKPREPEVIKEIEVPKKSRKPPKKKVDAVKKKKKKVAKK